MIRVLADENIASLDAYFCHHQNVKVMAMAGRQLVNAIDEYQPDALLVRSVTPVNADTLKDNTSIKFVGTATLGTDHIDTQLLADRGIGFSSAVGSSRHSVAQYVITALLTKNPDLIDKPITLGIIGLGNIGTTLANYAKEFNWQILGYDPYLPNSTINNSSFDHLLKTSDVISIHTPLTKTGDYPTYQLFNKNVLNQLKNNAILINTARGEIINQLDLLNAIEHKNLQVILDVFPFEPMIDKVLLDKLVIATPHIAGYTLDGKLRGTDMIYRAFCEFFDLPILQTMDKLLPANSYQWQTLKTDLFHHHFQVLSDYYDILADDANLRKNLKTQNNKTAVFDGDFDYLRKNYFLKREWLF